MNSTRPSLLVSPRAGWYATLNVVLLCLLAGLAVPPLCLAHALGRWNEVVPREDFLEAAGVLVRMAAVLQLGPAVIAAALVALVSAILARWRSAAIAGHIFSSFAAFCAFLPLNVISWLAGARLVLMESLMAEPPRCGQPIFGFIVFLVSSFAIMPLAYAVSWAGFLMGRYVVRQVKKG